MNLCAHWAKARLGTRLGTRTEFGTHPGRKRYPFKHKKTAF
jgi:hypothetical protein